MSLRRKLQIYGSLYVSRLKLLERNQCSFPLILNVIYLPAVKMGTLSPELENSTVTKNTEYLEFECVQFVASVRLNQGGPHM